jgi:hypothetical protein
LLICGILLLFLNLFLQKTKGDRFSPLPPAGARGHLHDQAITFFLQFIPWLKIFSKEL